MSVCEDFFDTPAVNGMNDNEQPSGIRAGKAFLTHNADDPPAQQSLAKAKVRLRAFAEGIQLLGLMDRQFVETMGKLFADIGSISKTIADDQFQKLSESEFDSLRAKQEARVAELVEELQAAQREMKADLAAHGFDPPQNSDDWEDLARLTEKEPGPMTMGKIYDWAIAWAKREALRLKIARGETPIQAGNKTTVRADIRSATDASIHHDEHDPRIAWCVGKRIYLGDDSQISRLFWLLASPVGRSCSLAEVQRAVDGLETTRDTDPTGEEYSKAGQRLRKAISKLRAAFLEAAVDDHLLIVRGGNAKYPEYTMVMRFGGS